MKNGWLYGLVFGSTWIALKMLAFALNWKLDEIQIFVLLNMAFLTAAIALFMYRKQDVAPVKATYSPTSKQA